MKRNILILLLSTLLSLLYGCNSGDESNSYASEVTTPETLPTITDTSLFQYFKTSDVQGFVDLTQELTQYGYDSSGLSYVVEIKDSSGNPLPNIEVGFWIDENNNKINLQFFDPNGELITSYHHTSLPEISDTKTPSERTAILPAIRFIAQIIMRTLVVYDTASTIHSVYQLFNVELEFEKHEESLVFQGTVSEFYDVYVGLVSIKHLPFVLSRNIHKVDNTASAKGAIKFDDTTIKYALLDFLKEMGGYAASNIETEIKVVFHKFDESNGFISIELVTPIDQEQPVSGELYDIHIKVNGNRSHSFDAPIAGSAPEFKGTVIIRNLALDILPATSAYSTEGIIRNVPLVPGEPVEVIIVDRDTLHDEDVTRFSFIFNGTTEETNETETTTTKLTITAPGENPQASNSPRYDISVNIQGYLDKVYDPFYSPPDFSGQIIIAGEYFRIKKVDNSFSNVQTIENVPIEEGEDIKVIIVEENIVVTEPVMDFELTFDGNPVNRENENATVSLSFTNAL